MHVGATHQPCPPSRFGAFIDILDQQLTEVAARNTAGRVGLADDYVDAVGWAQDYARANRAEMMELVIDALHRHLPSFEAMDEAFRIGTEGGVTVTIYHLKAASSPANWAKAPQMIHKIDSARASGLDVAATMYPVLLYR